MKLFLGLLVVCFFSCSAFAQNAAPGTENVKIFVLPEGPANSLAPYEEFLSSLRWTATTPTVPSDYNDLRLLGEAFNANIQKIKNSSFVVVGAEHRSSENLTPAEALWIGLAQAMGKPVLMVSPAVNNGFAAMVADVNRFSSQPLPAEFPNIYEAVTRAFQEGVSVRYSPSQWTLGASPDSMIPGFINGTSTAAWVNESVLETEKVTAILKAHEIKSVSVTPLQFSQGSPEHSQNVVSALTRDAQLLIVDATKASQSVFQSWLTGFSIGIGKPVLAYTSDNGLRNALNIENWNLTAGLKYSMETRLSSTPIFNFNVILRTSVEGILELSDLHARQAVNEDLSVSEEQMVKNRQSLSHYLRRAGSTEQAQVLQCRQLFLR